MKLQLLRDSTANGVLVKCEGIKTWKTEEGEFAIDHHQQEDESAIDLKPTRQIDMKRCRIFRDKLEKMNAADVHYNWKIAYLMMEGYLGHVDSVEKSYRRGHDILMELIYDENEKKTPDAPETTYRRYRDLCGVHKLGLVDVFNAAEMKEFGELVLEDGVLTTLKHTDRKWTCSSLLLHGDKLTRKVLTYFGESLKYFAYFSPRPNLVALKLPTCVNLSVLILRGCEFLEEINECIKDMTHLIVLEISGSRSITSVPGDLFTKLTSLKSLNLSCLAIEALPKESFPKLVNLRWLILRGCSRFEYLPSTRGMTNLEVLDLFGAKSLSKMSTTLLRKDTVKVLDLSNTSLKRVPCLFSSDNRTSKNITHLFLRNCVKINVFKVVEYLVSLQVLDLSGSKGLKMISVKNLKALLVLDLSGTSLEDLEEGCFDKLIELQDLNLSKTNIESIPEISHLSSLLRLKFHDCEKLKTLPKMDGLTSLEVLDISGCKLLEKIEEIPFEHFSSLHTLNLSKTKTLSSINFLHHLKKLQVLDLSYTSITELPSMSHLGTSLKQLLLAGCSELKSVPDLKALDQLEVLDLSGTSIGNEVVKEAPSSLQKLLLKDCSMIKESLPLSSLTMLQELDLEGTGVTVFPHEIKKMTRLECLRLPHVMNITRVEWSKIEDCLPREISWDQAVSVFESSKIVINCGTNHSMSATPSDNTHLFRLVDTEHSWEAYLKQFHFFVPSSKDGNQDSEIHFDGIDLVFRVNPSLPRKFPDIEPKGQSVEIHGLSTFPDEAKCALKQAVNVALIGNSFFEKSLSGLCSQYMEAMKVCWVSRCNKMSCVLQGENHEAFKCLETLVLSNLKSLKSFCSENAPSQTIGSLKHVYIDCCPLLTEIITAPHLIIQNVETLHVRYCDAVVGVVCSESTTSPCTLPQLRELNLLGLSELKHIGADLPSLDSLVISQCFQFNDLGRIMQCAGSKLTRLSLDCCPKLQHVFSSSVIPENLKVLEIRSCDELETVCLPTSTVSLPSLRDVELWNLPKLQNIGVNFPSLETCQIKYCSRLPRNLWPEVSSTAETTQRLDHELPSTMDA